MKQDLVCVLSGDVPTTELRIERALMDRRDLRIERFLLNGFNTRKQHDIDFQGEDWLDDPRVQTHRKELEKIRADAVYARNTVENGVALRRYLQRLNLLTALTVSSETHIPRVKQIFEKVFPRCGFEYLTFDSCPEPNEELRLSRSRSEVYQRLFTGLMLFGLSSGRTDMAEVYVKRRYETKLGDLLTRLTR